MVRRRTETDRLEETVDNNRSRSRSSLCNIFKHPSTYTEATLKRTIDHFYLSEGHRYRAPRPTEYLPISRPGEVATYQDSLKAGLRFPLHPFLVEFFCTFNLTPGQIVPNAFRMLNYYLLVCVRRRVEPSVDVFRLLFEMKVLDRYDCYVVFSHRDRDWGVPPLEEFNSTPILSEQEIDSLIILRATEPLGRSMNDALTDDALVSAGIGRPYDMSADQFTEDFLEELAKKNTRGQRKRRRENRPIPSPSSDVALVSGQQTTEPAEAQEARGMTEQLRTPESSRPRSPHVVSGSRPTCNMRWPIEKVVEDCQAITSCLDWEVIETSKDTSVFG
ncbi:Uncharacterized protein Adt_05043 [Abeliophyllum distichum]|uniref:Transposase (putative) gypsy type domain-containing protein n=1 Tax=Abeliophyllum distichum TaxID=126358 RepID=A0ABD1V309_9LAMI